MDSVLENFLFSIESMVYVSVVEIPEQFKGPHSLFGNLDTYQTHGYHQMGSRSILVILLMKNSGEGYKISLILLKKVCKWVNAVFIESTCVGPTNTKIGHDFRK